MYGRLCSAQSIFNVKLQEKTVNYCIRTTVPNMIGRLKSWIRRTMLDVAHHDKVNNKTLVRRTGQDEWRITKTINEHKIE